jgi:Predicted transcriptional regulators
LFLAEKQKNVFCSAFISQIRGENENKSLYLWLICDINMEDVNRIKLVLVEKKRTSKWLAEQLGVNPSTVSKWCTNSSQPDLACILKIADLLEVDLKELFVREYKQYLLSQESK